VPLPYGESVSIGVKQSRSNIFQPIERKSPIDCEVSAASSIVLTLMQAPGNTGFFEFRALSGTLPVIAQCRNFKLLCSKKFSDESRKKIIIRLVACGVVRGLTLCESAQLLEEAMNFPPPDARSARQSRIQGG
jgi:hypothetical protein